MRDWDTYVDLLKGGDALLAETIAPVNEQLRAELYRQFAMNLSQGYFLLFQADPDYPEFVPFENTAYLLQPNPDAAYYYARVDGAGTYRVVGERGNSPVAGFATGNRIIGTSDKPGKGFANYDIDDLTLDAEGRFEVIFSAERPTSLEGDWLRLEPEADFILVRQFSYDWGRETDLRIAIERLDGPAGVRPRMSPGETGRRLEMLAEYAKRLSRVAIGSVRRPHDAGHVNAMHIHTFQDLGNGRDWPQAYFEMVFDIAPDEALVIESDLPETRPYWNVQVVDGQWNQVDVLYHQSSLNGATARVDQDGKFRAVLSAEDPGYANWLSTGGHIFGMLIGRWYRCSSQPTPQVKRLKAHEMSAYLGERSPRITPEDRRIALRERAIQGQLRRKW
jgi:hypothetical protein